MKLIQARLKNMISINVYLNSDAKSSSIYFFFFTFYPLNFPLSLSGRDSTHSLPLLLINRDLLPFSDSENERNTPP